MQGELFLFARVSYKTDQPDAYITTTLYKKYVGVFASQNWQKYVMFVPQKGKTKLAQKRYLLTKNMVLPFCANIDVECVNRIQSTTVSFNGNKYIRIFLELCCLISLPKPCIFYSMKNYLFFCKQTSENANSLFK